MSAINTRNLLQLTSVLTESGLIEDIASQPSRLTKRLMNMAQR